MGSTERRDRPGRRDRSASRVLRVRRVRPVPTVPTAPTARAAPQVPTALTAQLAPTVSTVPMARPAPAVPTALTAQPAPPDPSVPPEPPAPLGRPATTARLAQPAPPAPSVASSSGRTPALAPAWSPSRAWLERRPSAAAVARTPAPRSRSPFRSTMVLRRREARFRMAGARPPRTVRQIRRPSTCSALLRRQSDLITTEPRQVSCLPRLLSALETPRPLNSGT